MKKIVAFTLLSLVLIATLTVALNNDAVKSKTMKNNQVFLEGKSQASSFLALRNNDGGTRTSYSCSQNSNNEMEQSADTMEESTCAFTCPAKTGTCTTGTYACDEDLGNLPVRHACEYECIGGTYTTGTECSQNLCYGGRCG